MPHLAPLSWPLALISLWLLLLLLISHMWWLQLPTFPHLPLPPTASHNTLWTWK